MLEPDELARAMGFEGYEFKGTKKQKVLMIGNAVEVNTAKALCKAILKN
jgi:site-specific DNA-cytosine methylase